MTDAMMTLRAAMKTARAQAQAQAQAQALWTRACERR